MGSGFLQIYVRQGTSALPIEGATYIIKDSKNRPLYSGQTDLSGNSNMFALNTPNASVGLSPQTGVAAFATYNIWITKTGFTPVNINDVHIFDKQTSYLPISMFQSNVELSPELDYTTPSPYVSQSTSYLGQQGTNNVLGANGIPLPGQTPDGVPKETRVLPSVAIPEYIIVHLGAPTNNAVQNIKVGFVDYIKNVLCSEIYPTWPQNAILANMYCVITFTLNRIYTEWYRSRGYEFDITNSTAYDQYFVQNREIFSNISELVDANYDTYIRRLGFKNPYFSAYCNGTTSTCKGLSQWGTVPLAQQGMDAIQILKTFYPEDIELVTAEYGSTESYGGTPLAVGDNAIQVQFMQDYLNRIALNYPLIPKIVDANGYFGQDTKNSVMTFQKTFGITADGIVGKATWNKISQIYSAVTQLSELNGEGERIGIGSEPPSSILKQGNKGADVSHLQFVLNYISAFYDSIQPPALDGAFGSVTANSVKQFQKLFGLNPDGIVGSTTWNKLYQVYKSIKQNDETDSPQTTTPPQQPAKPNPTPTTPPTNTPPASTPTYPNYLLKLGQRGNEIIKLQRLLNNARRTYPAMPLLIEDGIFGGATLDAVTRFQGYKGLNIDGVVGPLTYNALVSML